MKTSNIEKIIKIVESMMLMEGLAITKEDKDNIRECLSNGDIEYFDTYWKEDGRDDEFYCCTWEVPMVNIEYNGVELELSLLDLIDKGAKVYIEKYEI